MVWIIFVTSVGFRSTLENDYLYTVLQRYSWSLRTYHSRITRPSCKQKQCVPWKLTNSNKLNFGFRLEPSFVITLTASENGADFKSDSISPFQPTKQMKHNLRPILHNDKSIKKSFGDTKTRLTC